MVVVGVAEVPRFIRPDDLVAAGTADLSALDLGAPFGSETAVASAVTLVVVQGDAHSPVS
jgi:hypothetical protein